MDATPNKIKKQHITIGADPEFFLADRGIPISAIGLIGGTKENPAPMGRDGFFIQEDNVAVEFNIPPAKSLAEFVESITWSIDTIRRVVNENGLSVKLSSAERFDKKFLDHPKAMELGCDPDFNAWTGLPNPRPQPQGHHQNLRTAGGHVHVGWEQSKEDPIMFKRKLIQAMDLYLGVPSIHMDTSFYRRELYGKAGAFRIPVYGVEYRTLSNFWLRRTEYMQWVYAQTHRAFEFACDPANWRILDKFGPKIQAAINLNQTGETREMMEEFKLATV